MNKHYSILHISDLHKGENNDFDHLFASLCNDADSYDQDIRNHDICTLEFEPMTIAQVIAVMGASIETHNWDTFDKAVMSADKHGLRNWQTNVLIEDANKIR